MKKVIVYPQPQREQGSGRYTPAVSVNGETHIAPGYPLMGYEKALRISENVARLASTKNSRFVPAIWSEEVTDFQNTDTSPHNCFDVNSHRASKSELWFNSGPTAGICLAAVIFIIMLIVISIVSNADSSSWIYQSI